MFCAPTCLCCRSACMLAPRLLVPLPGDFGPATTRISLDDDSGWLTYTCLSQCHMCVCWCDYCCYRCVFWVPLHHRVLWSPICAASQCVAAVESRDRAGWMARTSALLSKLIDCAAGSGATFWSGCVESHPSIFSVCFFSDALIVVLM